MKSILSGKEAATATWLVFVVMFVPESVSCTPPEIATYFCEFTASFGSHAAVAIAPTPYAAKRRKEAGPGNDPVPTSDV